MADVIMNGAGNGFPPAPPADPIDRPPTPPPPPDAEAPPPPPDSYIPPPPTSDVPPPPKSILVDYPTEESDLGPVSLPNKKKKMGWGAQPKTAPLSVEELLRKKREADEAASKVCFNSVRFGESAGDLQKFAQTILECY